MKKITQHECRVLLVINKKKIYGYLQEGDIKRALLKKIFDLNSSIEKILNRDPFTIEVIYHWTRKFKN